MPEGSDSRVIDEDVKVLHHMGYAQELARRMGGFSNFAISFSIICILAGGITAFPVAFSAGGPFSVVVGWLIGGLFGAAVVGVRGFFGAALIRLWRWAAAATTP